MRKFIKEGTFWEDGDGLLYKVICIANFDNKSPNFPETVVYESFPKNEDYTYANKIDYFLENMQQIIWE